MKKISYDDSGNITGHYDTAVHVSIPPQSIEISGSEYLAIINDPKKYVVNVGTEELEEVSGFELAAAKTLKQIEIDQAYDNDLSATFSSSALGAPHYYESTVSAQAWLNSLVVAGNTASYPHVDAGYPTLVSHTPPQLETLLDDFIAERQAKHANYATKCAAIVAAGTVMAVNSIAW